jgi:hypothetical protein
MQDRPDSESTAPAATALRSVHMFWHGPPLTRVERLSMRSWLANGHPLVLHAYEPPAGLPPGVQVADARAILPESALFAHAGTGSYALFADWFRYRLLARSGGLWADTDTVCLRPLDYAQAELYAWEDDRQVNNAILGLPAGHALALWMAGACECPNRFLPYDGLRVRLRKLKRRWMRGGGRSRLKWGETGPLGLTAAARHLGCLDRALPAWHFYPVTWRDWRSVFEPGSASMARALERSRALHLYNEMMRREPGFDKDGRHAPDSLYESLCARYGCESA